MLTIVLVLLLLSLLLAVRRLPLMLREMSKQLGVRFQCTLFLRQVKYHNPPMRSCPPFAGPASGGLKMPPTYLGLLSNLRRRRLPGPTGDCRAQRRRMKAIGLSAPHLATTVRRPSCTEDLQR